MRGQYPAPSFVYSRKLSDCPGTFLRLTCALSVGQVKLISARDSWVGGAAQGRTDSAREDKDSSGLKFVRNLI